MKQPLNHRRKRLYIYIYILLKKTALENTYACTLKLQANKEKLTKKLEMKNENRNKIMKSVHECYLKPQEINNINVTQ